MRLSTSTNIMDRYQKVQGAVSMECCLSSCAAAGYRVMDMNFHDMSNPGMPMSLDSWQDWTEHIKEPARWILNFRSHTHTFIIFVLRVLPTGIGARSLYAVRLSAHRCLVFPGW